MTSAMATFTVHDLLARAADRRPDHPAVIDGTRTFSYAELAAEVDRVAAWLESRGVARGDRVGIHLPKCAEEIAATFAVARIGAVFVNLHHQQTAQQLAYVAGDCGIAAWITDARLLAKIPDPGRGALVRGAAWSALPTAAPRGRRPISTDLCALLYTSGSTGGPKGVMLTHANVVAGARSVASYLENTEDDRILAVLPMSFDYGMSQVTTAFRAGATVVLQGVSMPAEISKTARAQRVTGLAGVPPLWIQLARHLQATGERLEGLRYATNSGGSIPTDVLDRLPALLPGARFFLMYGLTEAFRACYLDPSLYDTKRGAIGGAIPDAEVFVVDDERGICGPGETGELVQRGALVSPGYWNNPAATDRVFKVNPHLVPLLGEEKVLHSGDLVRIDADGVLWFVSRRDAMIKCSGFRISPTEVEDALHASGLVADAVAFGVKDAELGEVVHAAVSGREGAVDLAALAAHCRKVMPQWMVPRGLTDWGGPMPRTTSGKLDRPAVIGASQPKGEP